MAWISGWDKRIKLTIDKDLVDTANQTNFPVMVYISAASGIGDVDASCVFDELTADANRKKIAVTSSDGTTELYVEIEKWDDANEKAWLHVKVPSVAYDADTILYLYYDADHADNDTYVGDTTDAVTHNVWDADFVGVWHMAQDPYLGVTDAIKDSTSNANHGSSDGAMQTEDLVNGQVGKALDFDAINDIIQIDDHASLDITSALTIEAICKTSAASATMRGICAKYDYRRSYKLSYNADEHLVGYVSDDGTEDANHFNSVEGTTAINDNTFRHAAIVFDPSTSLTLYLNGTQEAQNTTSIISSINSSSAELWIACNDNHNYSTNYFEGVIDEVRISSTNRSAAWIKATYHSLWDSLITFSAEEINLTVAGSDQLQTVDGDLVLTQKHTLAMQGADQLQTVDNITITQKHLLVVQGTDQLQTVDGDLVLTQKHTLTMQGGDQLQVADGDLVLIQNFTLVVQGTDQLQTVDGGLTLVVNLLKNVSADQLQTVDNITITQKHLLVVQGTDQLQTVDGDLVLTQKHTLTMQGGDQLQVADNVGALFRLAMQGADQLQTADNVSVNLHLAPAGADQLQTVDTFAITQKHTLAMQGADQLQTVDSFYVEWPGWLTLYGKEATKFYYCTLTGTADSLSDLTIPMSSFQARRKDGDPTYLSLVTPGTSQKTAIEARANGQLVITCKYEVAGQDDREAEIMRVDYETVRSDQGSKKQSLTLTGHITESFTAKTVTLLDPTYKRDDDGYLAYRCATPDPFLNPGDTAECGNDSFTCEGVVYIIGANTDGSVQASMEVDQVDA